MASVSLKQLAEGTDEEDFYKGKLLTAKFYFKRLLPRTRALVETMMSDAEDLMALDAEQF
jgi:hypothetical protein